MILRRAQRLLCRTPWMAMLALGIPTGSVTGCSPAPSQTILGSYFPSWMVCTLAGMGATLVVRQILILAGIDKTLPVPLLVYLALVIAFAFATWLAWLG